MRNRRQIEADHCVWGCLGVLTVWMELVGLLSDCQTEEWLSGKGGAESSGVHLWQSKWTPTTSPSGLGRPSCLYRGRRGTVCCLKGNEKETRKEL